MAKYAAFGAKLQYKPESTWVDQAGVKDISGPGLSTDTIDVTSHDSAGAMREFVAGLKDPGEVSFEAVFDPKLAGHAALVTRQGARTVDKYRLVFATTPAETWEFDAIVTGIEPSNPVEGYIGANVTLKVSGAIVMNPT
jgi:predicted secreted protein